jgi:hypothetical protein
VLPKPDPDYVAVLVRHPRLRNRFLRLFRDAISEGNDEDSAERACLQAKFRDLDFAFRTALRVTDYPNRSIADWRERIARMHKELRHLRGQGTFPGSSHIAVVKAEIARLQPTLAKLEKTARLIKTGRRPPDFELATQFDIGGWDIAIVGTVNCFFKVLPTIGDDYRVTLSRMKTSARSRSPDTWGQGLCC